MLMMSEGFLKRYLTGSRSNEEAVSRSSTYDECPQPIGYRVEGTATELSWLECYVQGEVTMILAKRSEM
jgi:hypothetical protein